MKRKRNVLLTAFFLAGALFRVNAQMAVTAPILEGIIAATYADQVVYYAQSIAQLVASASTAYDQFNNMLRMEQMALDNLKGMTDVKSWDDFMSWYNRQLYLERQAENKFLSLGVNIGGENVRISEINQIPDALKTEYVDHWGPNFTPAQRRKMWLNLGLAPSNYMYIQTWKAREQALAKSLLTKPETINEDNMAAMERNNEIRNKLAEDRDKPEDQRMGEKEIASMSLEVNIDTNRAIREMAYDQAEANAWTVTTDQERRAPPNSPGLSEMWGRELFEPISEE
jgi:hypothetical protein